MFLALLEPNAFSWIIYIGQLRAAAAGQGVFVTYSY